MNLPVWAQILSLCSIMFASGVLLTHFPPAPAFILLILGLTASLTPTHTWPILLVATLILWIFAIIWIWNTPVRSSTELAGVGYAYSVYMVIFILPFVILLGGFCIAAIIRFFQWFQYFSSPLLSWQYKIAAISLAAGIICGVLEWVLLGKNLAVFTSVLSIFLLLGGLFVARGNTTAGTVLIAIILVIMSFKYIPASYRYASAMLNIRLLKAARAGNNKTVNKMLNIGVNIHVSEYGYLDALAEAAENGHLDTVNLLLERGTWKQKNIDSAIHKAQKNNHTEIVKRLLEASATKDSKKEVDPQLLVNAAQDGNVETVKMLLAAGVDVNARDKYYKQTALYEAVVSGSPETVFALLSAGADVNARPDENFNFGETPLIAASTKNAEIVKLLIDEGADVNIKNSQGQTALMMAAFWHTNNIDIVKMLLDNGADVNAKDNQDKTALDYAKKEKHTKIANLLKQYGGKQGFI